MKKIITVAVTGALAASFVMSASAAETIKIGGIGPITGAAAIYGSSVMNGMACHTEGQKPVTLEGQVVRLADRIAFLNHDFEDAVSAGAMTEDMIPELVKSRLGTSKSQRITTLIRSIIDNYHDGVISMDEATEAAFREFSDFMYDKLYLYMEGKPKKEERKVYGIVESLYNYYHDDPGAMPAFFVETAFSEGVDRAVTDYISGMSDEFATRTFEDLFIPKSWPVS